MEVNDSMTLASFIMFAITCVVCGEEEGEPALKLPLNRFLGDVISIGWQVREFEEVTGPVCPNCIERPADDQAIDVTARWGVESHPPSN